MRFIVLRHTYDLDGVEQDTEPTGYEFEDRESAVAECGTKNDIHGSPFVGFTVEEVEDE